MKIRDIINLIPDLVTIHLCDSFGFIEEITDINNEEILNLEIKYIFPVQSENEEIIGIEIK